MSWIKTIAELASAGLQLARDLASGRSKPQTPPRKDRHMTIDRDIDIALARVAARELLNMVPGSYGSRVAVLQAQCGLEPSGWVDEQTVVAARDLIDPARRLG